MGKRNSTSQQVTAPTQNGQRKSKANTINVDELTTQGATNM